MLCYSNGTDNHVILVTYEMLRVQSAPVSDVMSVVLISLQVRREVCLARSLLVQLDRTVLQLHTVTLHYIKKIIVA